MTFCSVKRNRPGHLRLVASDSKPSQDLVVFLANVCDLTLDLDHFEAFVDHFGDVFVLMLQQRERVTNVVPLSLAVAAIEPSSQFLR